MPTPLELLLDPVSLAILALYAGLALAEYLWPARALVSSPWWRVRGLAAFGFTFLLSSYLPLFWDGLLAQWQLFDLAGAGPGWQVLAGLAAYELVFYGWHRSLHGSDRLWRWFSTRFITVPSAMMSTAPSG